MPSGTTPPVFDPNQLFRAAQLYVEKNPLVIVLMIGIAAAIAIIVLSLLFDEYNLIPVKYRSFKKGRTNIMQTIREEILQNMKKHR